MEDLFIEGTPKTPTVSFNNENGLLEIKGRSIPENAVEFYAPLLEWFNEFSKVPAEKIQLNVHLEYFNTSSSKCLLDIFKCVESIHKEQNNSTIKWYYEEDDEDMQEAGEDYESILKVPFLLVEIVK